MQIVLEEKAEILRKYPGIKGIEVNGSKVKIYTEELSIGCDWSGEFCIEADFSLSHHSYFRHSISGVVLAIRNLTTPKYSRIATALTMHSYKNWEYKNLPNKMSLCLGTAMMQHMLQEIYKNKDLEGLLSVCKVLITQHKDRSSYELLNLQV